MNWAIVIGIDEYGDEKMQLSGAVADALRFRDWVRAEEGGNVPPSNLRLLLGRRLEDSDRSQADVVPTKDNIVSAINDVVTANEEGAKRLYFFFAGHGITAPGRQPRRGGARYPRIRQASHRSLGCDGR